MNLKRQHGKRGRTWDWRQPRRRPGCRRPWLDDRRVGARWAFRLRQRRPERPVTRHCCGKVDAARRLSGEGRGCGCPSSGGSIQAAIIVWWMPCLADSSAKVCSPRIASNATLALISAPWRLRATLPISSRFSLKRDQLVTLSETLEPPQSGAAAAPDDRRSLGIGHRRPRPGSDHALWPFVLPCIFAGFPQPLRLPRASLPTSWAYTLKWQFQNTIC